MFFIYFGIELKFNFYISRKLLYWQLGIAYVDERKSCRMFEKYLIYALGNNKYEILSVFEILRKKWIIMFIKIATIFTENYRLIDKNIR